MVTLNNKIMHYSYIHIMNHLIFSDFPIDEQTILDPEVTCKC